MTETMTEVLAGNLDSALRVRLLAPGVQGAVGTVYELTDIFDTSISFNDDGTPGVLDVWTYKDSAGAAQLQGDYELQVDIFDPRENRYTPIDDGRFLVDTYEDERVEETNTVHYRCPSVLMLLDKVRLERAVEDYQLNNAYDRALERLNTAERDYERALDNFEDLATRVRRLHGLGGKNYAYYGVGWISRSRNVPHGSLASNATQNGRLYYYSTYSRRWLRLPAMPYPDRKQELRDYGVELADARRVYNAARDVYDKAERAARETSRDGRRYFYNSSPGRTITRAWGEGIIRDNERGFTQPDRGVLKGRRRTFNNANSSTGAAWPRWTRTSHDFPLGTSVLKMMQDFQERGLADFKVRGSSVDLVPAGALDVDQSERVFFQLSRDLTGAPERGSRMHHFSVAMVVGGDGYSRTLTYSGGVRTAWGYWEDTISEPASESVSTARDLTLKAREQASRRHKIESTLGVILGPSSAIPMIDYQPRHTVSVWDHEGERSKRRISQIVLRWSPESPMTAVITLGDRFSKQATNFARTMSKTLGGVDHLQGHVPRDPALDPPIISARGWMPPPLYVGDPTLSYDTSKENWTVRLPVSFADPGMPEPAEPDALDAGLPVQETDPVDEGFDPPPPDDGD